MGTSILFKFLTLKWNILRTIWHIEVGDGSSFCIFHALSFKLNFFFDWRFPLIELSGLSSWKEMVQGQIEERISKIKHNFKQPTGKMLQNAGVKACLSDLHNKYVFVPGNKAPNNIIIISKRYYIETLIKELGLDNCSTPTGNSTYTSCQMSSEDIVNTHDTFMKSFGIELSDNDKRLPYLHWTPKQHKSPVKHRFIAGCSKCITKQLSSLLTKILTVIKTGLEKCCSIKTSHTGVNNMWILKNSTNLLSSLGHLEVHRATSIQTFDFSTLYTFILHDLLKSRMNNIINTKMELNDTPTSKLAKIKAISPVFL